MGVTIVDDGFIIERPVTLSLTFTVKGCVRDAFNMLLLTLTVVAKLVAALKLGVFKVFNDVYDLFKVIAKFEVNKDDDVIAGEVLERGVNVVLDVAEYVDAVCVNVMILPGVDTAVLNSPPVFKEVAVCNEDANEALLVEQEEEEEGALELFEDAAKHIAEVLPP